MNLHSIANFRQSKTAKERFYMYVDRTNQALNIMKIPLIFDPRASPECVENYLIKQQIYEGKSLKKAIIFN